MLQKQRNKLNKLIEKGADYNKILKQSRVVNRLIVKSMAGIPHGGCKHEIPGV